LTDEAFSVMSFNKEKLNTEFALAVELGPYLAWGIFTPVGYLIGQLMPKISPNIIRSRTYCDVYRTCSTIY